MGLRSTSALGVLGGQRGLQWGAMILRGDVSARRG
jgi:hypothetical protein